MTRSDIINKWEEDGSSIEEAITLIHTFGGKLYDVARIRDFSYRLKIVHELESYRDDQEAAPPSTTASAPQHQIQTSSIIPQEVAPTTVPEEVVIIQLKRRTILKLRDKAHTIMKLDSISVQERFELAYKIETDYNPEIDRLSRMIKAWKQDGTIPPIERSTLIQEINKKHARIKRITEHCSQLRRQLKKATKDKATAIQDKIDELQEERDALKIELQL